jgi:SAM-dependent methyltransferase
MDMKQRVRAVVYSHPLIRDAWLNSQKVKRRFLYLKNYGIPDWFFDNWNRVETAAVIPDELKLHRPAEATDYLPVRPRILLKALSSLAIDYAKYVFIDVGSGKGRGVFLASSFPFRKLIGVEISKELHEKARKNSSVWHVDDARRIDLIWTDISDFEFPNQPLVLFLFHPFGPDMMRVMLDQIRGSTERFPREIIMIYVNPEHESVIGSCLPKAERISSFAGKYCYVTYRLSQVPLSVPSLPEHTVKRDKMAS